MTNGEIESYLDEIDRHVEKIRHRFNDLESRLEDVEEELKIMCSDYIELEKRVKKIEMLKDLDNITEAWEVFKYGQYSR